MRLVASLLLALLAASAASAEKKTYEGYKVYRVVPAGEANAKTLLRMELPLGLDFWTELRVDGGHVDIMVAPGRSQILFVNMLETLGMEYSVMIEDVQETADLSPMVESGSKKTVQGHSMDWDDYHPLEDMYEYFDYLEETNGDVTVESIGSSYEGRDMRVAKICRGGCGNKPSIYIEGGIHAREWISPAVVTFMVRELTENLSDDDQDLVDELDWYFLPVTNPDGYAYTQSDNRMWRKTRTPQAGGCTGVDANRNFGYHWDVGGASDNACSDSYHGTEPWSEMEVANVRDFVEARKDRLMLFNDVHSYSQLILMPWGFTTDDCPDHDEMYDVFDRGNDALYATHGMVYELGCTPCILYTASGIALDWGKGGAGIKYSTSMELRDTGRYGFLLPPEQIIPNGEEVWAFHKSVARDIIQEAKQ